jgi:hypothetical protein
MANTYTHTNIAPAELNKPFLQHLNYNFALTDSPTELIFANENQNDQLVYQLYELTEEEIKIVEGK